MEFPARVARTFEVKTSKNNELTVGYDENIDVGRECKGSTFCSLRNMAWMPQFIENVSRIKLTARFATTPSHARIQRYRALWKLVLYHRCALVDWWRGADRCSQLVFSAETSTGQVRFIHQTPAYNLSSMYATTRKTFAPVPLDIGTQFVGRRKKEDTSCGSPLNAISKGYGTFDEGSRFFVAEVSQDGPAIILSMSESRGLRVVVFETVKFLVMTVGEFLCSLS